MKLIIIINYLLKTAISPIQAKHNKEAENRGKI